MDNWRTCPSDQEQKKVGCTIQRGGGDHLSKCTQSALILNHLKGNKENDEVESTEELLSMVKEVNEKLRREGIKTDRKQVILILKQH